ncbi:MAG: hypothetical protein V7L21_05285 [Nostoc sp.]|uniref:hypothetical protein n=1 Tax=unclassified Nostoc TaxID=2593658 RepID=UPI0025CC6676|nr:hypothetical protein [Nostoc sp. NMS9]MBN3943218.1 hypothetical protein [Nostoc sp. NMS9]
MFIQQALHKSEIAEKSRFYPTLTLPDALGSHCVGRAMPDLFAQRLPLGEACGVREVDFRLPTNASGD